MKTQKDKLRQSTQNQSQFNPQFEEVSQLISLAQKKTLRLVNDVLVELYWLVGKYISQKVEQSEWGNGVVNSLSNYLKVKHPHLKGFSKRGLFRMKQFYEAYKDQEKVTAVRTQISWTHHRIILSQTHSFEERLFYINKSISEAYSSRELERQIKSSLYELSLLSSNHMSATLLKGHPESSQIFRDPYILEFLDLPEKHDEKDLRKGLLKNLASFILEAGRDFSLIGEEYRVQVGMEDFYIDLLLFHRGLQCLNNFFVAALLLS